MPAGWVYVCEGCEMWQRGYDDGLDTRDAEITRLQSRRSAALALADKWAATSARIEVEGGHERDAVGLRLAAKHLRRALGGDKEGGRDASRQ